MRRGFSEEEARIIGRNAADQKRRVAQAKAETEAALREAREARTADAEPIIEPDIGAPPPTDAEEEAARARAYAEQMGEAVTPPTVEPLNLSPIEQAAVDLVAAVDAGGVPFNTPRINAIAQGLGLDVSRNDKPEATIDRIRAAVGRFTPTPTVEPTPTPTQQAPTFSRAQAQQVIADIELGKTTESDVEASTGLSMADIYATAEDTTLKYSRGRRSKDTETADMFAGAPLQEAPGVEAKRAEFAEQRFATDEERAARDQQFAAEMEAGQERVLAMRQREEEQREETLGDIEYALRAQAPENAVYKVLYEPEDTNAPYKLVAETQLGKKPEEVLRAKTLQDFSDQVYGQMMELTPFTPEAPAALQEIEGRETGEQKAPTAATRMVQEFTSEVDAAREQGLIDNLQRSELLGRLQRPNAYRTLDGRQVPNDAIAKLEKEAIDAASVAANAPADQKEATAAASKEANDRLRAAVKNSLLNPARAKLKSMVETRQDEKLGAKQRVEGAKVQERLGKMEGRRTKEEREEAREAGIDLKEAQVQKYRRGAPKQPGGPPKVVSVERVQAIVDNITSKWKSKFRVVVLESVMDLDDRKLRRAIIRDGAFDANGFVAPDGTVYLVADNLLTEQDVQAVLFHESLGHLGLEQLFRNNLDNALVTMYRGNAKLRADTDKWRQDNPGAYENDTNPLARAVEEVLAERSENGQLERSLFDKIAAIIRNFARRMGFTLKISDGDVATNRHSGSNSTTFTQSRI